MLVKDDFPRYAWVYFLKHKSDAADAFRKFQADMRADGVPSKVEIVRSDNGGELFGGDFGEVCKQVCIKQEFTNADSLKQNGVVRERWASFKTQRLLRASKLLSFSRSFDYRRLNPCGRKRCTGLVTP